MKKVITNGLQKWRYLPFIPFKQILEVLLKYQKIWNPLFFFEFFLNDEVIEFFVAKKIVMLRKFVKTWLCGQLTTKPNTVRDYSNGMSRVDRSDQMLSYYQGLRNCIWWYKKIWVHFLDTFLYNSFYLAKQQYPESFKIPLLEYGTIAVKSLIGHYNHVALELGKYEKHFLKLICAGEKKRNPTLRSRVCYQNQIRPETRYRCEGCHGMLVLYAAPCFSEYHNIHNQH